MKITKIVDTPDGKFVFETELNSDQHKFIFETGLGYLVSIGAINLKAMVDEARSSVNDDDQTKQEPVIH